MLKNYQKGASLMEFMLYSVVALGVLIGSVMMYTSSKSDSTASQTQKDLNGIRVGMSSLRGLQADYSTVSISAMGGSKSLPSDMTVSGETATSTTGVTFTVDVSSPTVPVITATMPYDTCLKVMTAADTSWTSVGGYTPAVSSSNAASKCGTSGSVSIDFSFT